MKWRTFRARQGPAQSTGRCTPRTWPSSPTSPLSRVHYESVQSGKKADSVRSGAEADRQQATHRERAAREPTRAASPGGGRPRLCVSRPAVPSASSWAQRASGSPIRGPIAHNRRGKHGRPWIGDVRCGCAGVGVPTFVAQPGHFLAPEPQGPVVTAQPAGAGGRPQQ